MKLTELNNQFSIQSGKTRLHFNNGQGNIPVVVVENEQAMATISLQGAHLLSWLPLLPSLPLDQREVIWVSDDATFAPGKSIRGGIPICWPWFGAHQDQTDYPAHGFARTVMWQVKNTRALSDDVTQITFELNMDQRAEAIRTMWPWSTALEYRITISNILTLELITTNHSDKTFTLGQALHTYFLVGDISNTVVKGLEGKTYLDKTDGFKRKTQSGAIRIDSEVDRIYLDTEDDVVIENQERTVHISKQGSHSTVVWNPWQTVAEKMGDLGKDGYRQMLCVESANAAEDTVDIPPGQSHSLTVNYKIKPR